ncbi:MAG: DUF938 domain-containing protein [Oleiphilaceae bacterium]|nr:DUF938 domain-containing protein [Oleiphilaceae bacterium]
MPYSPACEKNKRPILAVLIQLLNTPGKILEIGTGTGQHAVYFAEAMPHLIWQPSDRPAAFETSWARVQAANLSNLRAPLPLDVTQSRWPVTEANAVYSANTAHIMAWPEVTAMFAGVARLLAPGEPFCLYGPFHYRGQATSASNHDFDRQLRASDPAMGIRDLDDLEPLADSQGLTLKGDIAMPANNRMLIWRAAS